MREPYAVPAETVGPDQVGAGVGIAPGDIRDLLRMSQVPKLRAVPDLQPLELKKRPPGPVRDEDLAG